MRSSHSASSMNGIFSLNAGTRDRARPVRTLPADVGRRRPRRGTSGRAPIPRRRSRCRCVPCARGEHALDDRRPPGCRATRGTRPACGPCDISRARAFASGSAMLRTLSPGTVGELRAGLEHDDARRPGSPRAAGGRRPSRSARCRRWRWWGGATWRLLVEVRGGGHAVAASAAPGGGVSSSSDSRPFGQQQRGDDAERHRSTARATKIGAITLE